MDKVKHMKKLFLSCIFPGICIITTGCSSTSMYDSLALIEQEENRINSKHINKKVLMNIQALRTSQKATLQSYTFVYQLDNKELNYDDKMKIAKLLIKRYPTTIKIAPAKGDNKLKQLTLSMERAKALHQYIEHFSKEVTIVFSPELSANTINLVVGA